MRKSITKKSKYIYSLEEVKQNMLQLVGRKALNLSKLYNKGFPVPYAYCVSTKAHSYFLKRKKLPTELSKEIIKIKSELGGKIAIRSSANCEDNEALSMAGVFESHYVYEDKDVKSTIQSIYSKLQNNEVMRFIALHGLSSDDVKIGLVIQKLVEPDIAGVIYTNVNNKLLIQYTEHFGMNLVAGKAHGSAILINKKGDIVESVGFESNPISEIVINQIVDYSIRIEKVFKGAPQDIEFAYKGGQTYILQARNLTTDIGRVSLEETPIESLERAKYKLEQLTKNEKDLLKTKTAVFSKSNFEELLPKPTEMDFGIFAYIFTGSNAIPGAIQLGRKEMGYELGDETIGFLHYIAGKPYFSISLDAGTFYIGLPEPKQKYYQTVVNDYLRQIQKHPEKAIYPEMNFYHQDFTLPHLMLRHPLHGVKYYKKYSEFKLRIESLAQNFFINFQNKVATEIKEFIKNNNKVSIYNSNPTEIIDFITQILEHLRTKTGVNFVKAARLGFYYSNRLKIFLKKNLKIEGNDLDQAFALLTQGLDNSSITDVNIKISEASNKADALLIAQELIQHFSTGGLLEISPPRLKDNPGTLEYYVEAIRKNGQYKENYLKQKLARIKYQNWILAKTKEPKKNEIQKYMKYAQTYMALRESIKYLITFEYDLIRKALEILNTKLKLEKNDIYFLYPRELNNIVSKTNKMHHLMNYRKKAYENYKSINLPHVIKETDIKNLKLNIKHEGNLTEITGRFLAHGAIVNGIIVNIDEFEVAEKAALVIENYLSKGIPVVLAATQIDLGHDPLISLASGLIIENAAIVSHGAQRARELGKGAIGGINSNYFKTGTKVHFNPIKKIVRAV